MAIDALKQANSIKFSFEDALNRHGYTFQHRLIQEIEKPTSGKTLQWVIEFPEFPVMVQERDSRIDIVLKHRWKDAFMVCECKRVNPKFGHWCFAKWPEWRPFAVDERRAMVTQETIWKNPSGNHWKMNIHPLSSAEEIYDIGIEVETTEKGDPVIVDKTGAGAIIDAQSQALRGQSGLIEYCKSGDKLQYREFAFIPTVFTTANLWVTDTDLAKADISTGKAGLINDNMEQKTWLFCRFHTSISLRHSVEMGEPEWLFQSSLESEFVRYVAIVTPAGLEEFLDAGFWRTLPKSPVDKSK